MSTKSKRNMLAEYDPWAEAIAESHRDWWPDYARRPSVGCSTCGVVLSDVVAVLHARRTGHEVGRQPALRAA